MEHPLKLTNTLTRKKEQFVPIHAPFVGLYVCGPTVYGHAHLGHARPYITFDVLRRYLAYLGYKVRYVRNITDVGHLENDADQGEDKIGKKAKLENLEPMEIVEQFTHSFHQDMAALNILPPSIEPRASGHIPEQIALVEKILEAGLAYESNGSVYFDVLKYQEQKGDYGKLSGRIIEDLIANTRDLDGQSEKRNQLDFALWKKAQPEHIMRWPSPWSDGFPGWHLECSAMSAKYLGQTFDIHGGGMDLMFPHHECEIAQSQAGNNIEPVKYWMHCNMITIGGQKMGKSLGNFISLHEFFSGEHAKLEQAYSAMTIRFFILQAHYRSTLDFSNEGLQAAHKGYRKLMNGLKLLNKLKAPAEAENSATPDEEIVKLGNACFDALNDDLNTAKAIAGLYELLKKIETLFAGNQVPESVSAATFNYIKNTYTTLVVDILGLKEENSEEVNPYIDLILNFYKDAKASKDYAKVDQIRAQLKEMGIMVKDLRTGVDWVYER